MLLDIPPFIQQHLGVPAKVDTVTLDPHRLRELCSELCQLSERVEALVPLARRAAHQRAIVRLTGQLVRAIELPPVPSTHSAPDATPPARVWIWLQRAVDAMWASDQCLGRGVGSRPVGGASGIDVI